MYPTQVIKQFLNKDQLAEINQWSEAYDASGDIVPAPIGHYLGVSPEVDSMIKSLIPTLPNELLFVRILEATSPGGPHADNGLPLPLPDDYPIPNFARTFIIPLTNQETNTIVFNQAMPLGISIYDHMASLPALDVRDSVGQETYQRYLTHSGKDWMARLSIDVVFPWQAGDLLVFDRSRIHCSDNWAVNELGVKRGFVIWSEIR
jgi:hypothetical protein